MLFKQLALPFFWASHPTCPEALPPPNPSASMVPLTALHSSLWSSEDRRSSISDISFMSSNERRLFSSQAWQLLLSFVKMSYSRACLNNWVISTFCLLPPADLCNDRSSTLFCWPKSMRWSQTQNRNHGPKSCRPQTEFLAAWRVHLRLVLLPARSCLSSWLGAFHSKGAALYKQSVSQISCRTRPRLLVALCLVALQPPSPPTSMVVQCIPALFRSGTGEHILVLLQCSCFLSITKAQ